MARAKKDGQYLNVKITADLYRDLMEISEIAGQHYTPREVIRLMVNIRSMKTVICYPGTTSPRLSMILHAVRVG